VTVIVDLPVEPAGIVRFVGLAVNENAVPTVNVTVDEWDNGLLVPVIVTVKVPDVAESVHERVDVPDVVVLLSATLATLSMHTRPTVGVTLSVRSTVPVKFSSPVTVMVEDALFVRKTVTLVGFAATVKSWTVYFATTV
jgi:hypothetical protein